MFMCDKYRKKVFREGLVIKIPNNLISEEIMQSKSENLSDSYYNIF